MVGVIPRLRAARTRLHGRLRPEIVVEDAEQDRTRSRGALRRSAEVRRDRGASAAGEPETCAAAVDRSSARRRARAERAAARARRARDPRAGPGAGKARGTGTRQEPFARGAWHGAV